MQRSILRRNLPASNKLPIVFKATYETKTVLMELARLFADVDGEVEELTISETIRICIHFTYSRRKAIMMARLREQRRKEREQCQNPPNQQTGTLQ